MSKVVPQIRGYMAVAKRADDAFDLVPADDVSPLVEGLSDVAIRFDRLATKWSVIKAPPGLGLKHRGMGGAFRLQARAFAAWADGWRQFGDTNDVAVLTAANDHASGLLHSAAYLQKRWAAALSGALIRAYLPVPHWLEQMSMLVP